MIALVHKILISLNQALEHVQDELLVVVYEHSQDASNYQEYLVPLQITHFDSRLLILGQLDLE